MSTNSNNFKDIIINHYTSYSLLSKFLLGVAIKHALTKDNCIGDLFLALLSPAFYVGFNFFKIIG